METFIPVAIVVVIIAAFAAFVVGHQLHRRKVRRLTEWATGRDWVYTERDNSLRQRFAGDPFVGRGKVRHVIRGQHRGRSFVFFEYSYTTSSGNNSSTTHYYQVVAVRTPASVPKLQVSNEHFGHKLLGLLGVQDLQMGFQQFDDEFRIKTEHEGFARAFLHADTMGWLLADPRARDWPFRIAGPDILTWSKGRLDAERCVRMLDYVIDVLERAPDGVWRGQDSPGHPG